MEHSRFRNLTFSKNRPTENLVFKLVTRWTPCILLAFSLIITAKLALGHSFACATIRDAQLVSEKFLETRCYSEGVFVDQYRLSRDELRYPSSRFVQSDESKRIGYYSFVNVVFLLQAVVFYIPYLLRSAYERGYVSRLTSGLQMSLRKEQKRSMEIHGLAKHLLLTQGKHYLFSSMCVLFETCNFLICICQIIWLVRFFDVTSTPIGTDLSSWTSYRQFYFPSEGSCSVARRTTSGERLSLDAICVLPLNEVHMYMFLFLKGWYVFLTLATFLVLVYRTILLLPPFRSLVLRLSSPMASRSTVRDVCARTSYSDWVFLRAVQKLVQNVDFARLLGRFLTMSQNKGKDPQPQDDSDEKSSIYEDSC
ncbi:hypothetical protein JTE90_020387 [Oedothorax gibbosus]|uniref:Innexin n=1 Tax=Oedothorax gibbosus TaxID=931172 RepID=A0AAV6UF63_9ARAC|nr:hypothetical protein JTE90_020387 [Oedothorax gibbosus]